jgi:hypothetical protein
VREPRFDQPESHSRQWLERLLVDLSVASRDTLAMAVDSAAEAGVYLPAIVWLREMRDRVIEHSDPTLERGLVAVRDAVVADLEATGPASTADRELQRGTISSVEALLAAGLTDWYPSAARAADDLVARGRSDFAPLADALRSGDAEAAAAELSELRSNGSASA